MGATVDGSQASYLVDTIDGLPTLVDDGSKAYLGADGLLAEVGASGVTQLLGDALGSVRGLADGSGTLVGSRSYEAFGSPRTTSGPSSLFGFTGEPTDATGLVHLRARYLDTAIGRFLSADSFFPNTPGTQGYNLYSYAGDNPATWTDPSGHSVLTFSGPALLILITAIVLTLLIYPWFREMWIESGGPAALEQAVQSLGDRVNRTIDQIREWWHREPEKPRPVPCIPYLMRICTTGDDDDGLLYHYTSGEGLTGILACQCVWAATGDKNARFGAGAYFTDLAPGAVIGTTPGQLSYALYRVPWNARRVSYYVAVDPGKMANPPRWVHSLYGSTYSGGIYLAPSTGPTPVAGAIRDSGKVPF